jgi:hypothetical protein
MKVTIQLLNTPDSVVVRMASCVEMLQRQSKRFDNISIEGNQATIRNGLLR